MSQTNKALQTEGSLIAADVMTQDPRGRIVLRRDGQETESTAT